MSEKTMEYKHLGRSGLRVSRIGLGTMNFGDATDEAEAFEIMDRAVERGVNFFDTADVGQRLTVLCGLSPGVVVSLCHQACQSSLHLDKERCSFSPNLSVVQRVDLQCSEFVSVRDSHDLVGILGYSGQCVRW
ncbi:aldo/keto reductase [Rhodococcus sp. C26F]